MIYKKNVFVSERSIKDKVYIALDNEFYYLDQISYDIWKAIDGSANINDISKQIAKKYEADLEKVENDVEEYIKELLDNNLIKRIV